MHRFPSPRSSLLLVVVILLWSPVTADPQTNFLNIGCSQYTVTDPSNFAATLNATFAEIRSDISNARFATAERPRAAQPAYTLFQCRPYLSASDCTACLSVAEARIRRCGAANGARVIYDGCILRYESVVFFDTAAVGSSGVCGNDNTSATGFSDAVRLLLSDLSTATPRIEGYFAAVARDGVFAIAQCVNTATEQGCADCLAVGDTNIKSCPPAAEGRALDAVCFMRYSNKSFFPANQTVDLSPFLASSGKSSEKRALIGGVAGGVGVVLLLGLIALVWIKKSRDRQSIRKGDILGATELQGPLNFHYKDLKDATKNFSEENKLGEGGFGAVYKGVLKNGKTVAVKRMTIEQTSRAKEDFQSEVKLISNVHHRNLVRLLGCSHKGQDLLLVYEYTANSSLERFIYGDKHGFLNWKQRFGIIVGMARGLAYLHQEFHVCIIHRDIKSSNILLDDDFHPRIADFGLARLLPADKSHLSTNFAGTLGYTAPEYALHGQLSEKVDTYSYGIVVLELISGRKCNDVKLEPVTQYLLEWAWKLYESNELMMLVDETLDPSEYSQEEVKRVIEIALLCAQSSVAARPTMTEVVILLLSQGDDDFQLMRPTFIDSMSRVQEDQSSNTRSSAMSRATVSISQYSGR